MERTAIKHVDTVLTTQHVIMRTVPVHKAVQLVTRHTRVIQVSNMCVLAANSNLLYRLWDVLLCITNKPYRSVQETDLSVKETNRYVYKLKRNGQETKHIRPNLPLSLNNYDRPLCCLIFLYCITCKLSMI